MVLFEFILNNNLVITNYFFVNFGESIAYRDSMKVHRNNLLVDFYLNELQLFNEDIHFSYTDGSIGLGCLIYG